MAQTLGEMVTEATLQVGRTSAEARTVARASINRRYKELAVAHNFPAFHREISATVTAGRSTVGLPYEVESIESVWNTTVDCEIQRFSPAQTEHYYGPDMATTGALYGYFIAGIRGSIQATTGSATTLSVTSSSTQDNVGVTVEGHDENGLPFTMTATVNGTGAIPLTYPSGVAGPLDIDAFSKGSTTQGKITLSEPSGVGTIGVIAAKAREARYTWLRFNAVADVATAIRVQAMIPPDDLTADDDIPIIRGVETVLVRGATADLYRFLQAHQKAMAEENLFQGLKDEFLTRARLEDPPIQIVPLNYRSWEV